MRPKSLKTAIKTLYACKRSPFIWGSPGVGKSDVVKQVAEELGIDLIDLRVTLLDPVDLRGLCIVKNGITEWCTPSFLPTKGKGILFLDELNAATPSMQAASYQLLWNRKIGEYTLPAGWIVAAAGNRETDRAVTYRMGTALASRFVHLDFDVNNEDWLEWGMEHRIHPAVLAYIKYNPQYLHDFDPKRDEKAFPTPRTWEFVSDILHATPDREVEMGLIEGTIGKATAASFYGFLKVCRDLPDADYVLANPKTAPVPTDPAVLFALCNALSGRASVKTMKNLIEYANRLPGEFSVLLVNTVLTYNKSLVTDRAVIEWMTKHQNVLIGDMR